MEKMEGNDRGMRIKKRELKWKPKKAEVEKKR